MTAHLFTRRPTDPQTTDGLTRPLTRYTESFLGEGFEHLDDLRHIRESDFEAMVRTNHPSHPAFPLPHMFHFPPSERENWPSPETAAGAVRNL